MTLIPFTLTSLSVVLGLNWLKRYSKRADSTRSEHHIDEFLDWLEPQTDSSKRREVEPTLGEPSSDLEGENVLFRALASIGMAPTSPRQARLPRKTVQSPEHPATGNEDVADEVVHLKRVSQEEEAERYFSAFSYFT